MRVLPFTNIYNLYSALYGLAYANIWAGTCLAPSEASDLLLGDQRRQALNNKSLV
jgi:hypothetical protein